MVTDYITYPNFVNMSQTARKNLRMALTKVNQEAQSDPMGRSPADFPVVVDLQAPSLSMGWDVSPCLTKARGGSQAFFSLQHARRLSVNEMCRLQGLDSREMTINLSPVQMGHLLGNGFTCTVLARVLVSAIQAEERSRADTGAPAATGAANPKYAYDTPLHNVSAIGNIMARPAIRRSKARLCGGLRTAPVHQKPPYLKRSAIGCIKALPAPGRIKANLVGQLRTAPVRQNPPDDARHRRPIGSQAAIIFD